MMTNVELFSNSNSMTNSKLVPNSNALLATLVQIVKNLVYQINTILQAKLSPSPPHSHISHSHEEIADNHSNHQSPPTQHGANGWRAALHEQMAR